MAKIIPLKPTEEEKTLRDFLVSAVAALEKKGCTNALICAKAPDSEVVTGYYNLDVCERQELCAHIQCDIIDKMVGMNMDRYIEKWEGE